MEYEVLSVKSSRSVTLKSIDFSCTLDILPIHDFVPSCVTGIGNRSLHYAYFSNVDLFYYLASYTNITVDSSRKVCKC